MGNVVSSKESPHVDYRLELENELKSLERERSYLVNLYYEYDITLRNNSFIFENEEREEQKLVRKMIAEIRKRYDEIRVLLQMDELVQHNKKSSSRHS